MFSEGSGSSLASTATQDGDVKQINLPDGNRLQTKGADIPPPCSPSLESKRERGSAFVCCLPGWAPAASLGCGSTLLLVASPPPRWRRRSPGRRGGGCPRRPAPTAWGGGGRGRRRTGWVRALHTKLRGTSWLLPALTSFHTRDYTDFLDGDRSRISFRLRFSSGVHLCAKTSG